MNEGAQNGIFLSEELKTLRVYILRAMNQQGMPHMNDLDLPGNSCFTNEGMEYQRGEISCAGSHS